MDVKTQSAATGTRPSDAPVEVKADANWFGTVRFVAIVLLTVFAFRVFVVSPFSIPSESMLPRLMNGDFLLAAKWPYGYSRYSVPFNLPLIPGRVLASSPRRGDVVIFKHPVDRSDYIKRVIALPGDRVAVVGGQIVLNGEPVPREKLPDFTVPLSPNTTCAWGGTRAVESEGGEVCRYTRFVETLPSGKQYEVLDFGPTHADTFSPRIVPDGHMFVMGDNRDNSRDSRFPALAGDAVGIVPQGNLVGRASVIMFSTDGSAEWLAPWTWLSATRWSRIGAQL
jgi:signal peptidase I